MSDNPELLTLLREIRDNQREALSLQREYMSMYQQQLGRIERINDRAEAIQGRAGKAIKVVAWVAVPLVCLLLGLMLLSYLPKLFA
ncbi:hypothetical protein [Lysobacter tyrosinilyticus]